MGLITHGYMNGFHVRQMQFVFLTGGSGAADKAENHEKFLHVLRNIQMLNYKHPPR